MAVTRTRNKIQFVQDILSVFTAFRHSGKAYLEYLHQSRGGDEFDVRDMIVKPLLRKLGYAEQDFYNEVTIQSGEIDLNIGIDKLQPVITVETKASNTSDLKLAREQQLFPYIEELHTPIGIVTNGVLFEVWEQKKVKTLLVSLDFARIMAYFSKGGLDALPDDEFGRILKLMYLKKDIRYIRDEDLYAIPEIDISEPTSFQNLLNDMAKLMELTKIDVEEQFNIRMAEFEDYELQSKILNGWRLQKLQKESKQARQLVRYFHRWAEINNIDLEKNVNSRDKFITETMYILINRILLIRIAEDDQIIPRRISNGAIKDFQQFVGDIKINYNKLLDIAYDTMRGVYEHFFKHDIFDWYIPDSELLLRLLFVFNKYNFSYVNRDILGNLYQKYIDKDERKRLGQFYTPDEVVQYILDSVGYTSDADIENKTLLDPSCGSGGFLVPATNRLISRLKKKNYDPITILNKVRDNIYGFDINPFAAHLTETNLLFQVVDLISAAKKLDPDFRMEQFNVFVTDSLKIPEAGQVGKNMSLFENDFLNSVAVQDAEIVKEIKLKQSRFKDGMDFVVGNPPYLSILQMSDQDKEYFRLHFKSYKFRSDIFGLFIEFAFLRILKPKGKLGFIIPSVILNSGSYDTLRKLILEETRIKNIVDFQDGVFTDSIVPTVILILERDEDSKKRAKNEIIILRKMEDFVNKKFERVIIRQNIFEKTFNNIFNVNLDVKTSDILEKIKKGTKNLGSLLRINRGINTGNDPKYITEDGKDKDAKKVLRGGNINRYQLTYEGEFVLYKQSELHDPAREDNFLQPKKLLFRRLGCQPIATIDESQFYVLDTLYTGISLIDKLDLKYLLALINSKLIKYYYQKSIPIKGRTFPEARIFDLNEIPIKIAPSKIKKNIIRLVDKILQINKKIAEINNVVDKCEKLLDMFKAEFPQYYHLELFPLHDIPDLKHIQLEKRLGKPDIRREGLRVYLTNSCYLDFATESLAEYTELTLKSMQANLRGLTKPDILRLVKVPGEKKIIDAILKFNADLKKQQVKQQRQREVLNKEIDKQVYDLYGITTEDQKIIESVDD